MFHISNPLLIVWQVHFQLPVSRGKVSEQFYISLLRLTLMMFFLSLSYQCVRIIKLMVHSSQVCGSLQTYWHISQNASRAAGGQSINLPVCRLHLSLVWETIDQMKVWKTATKQCFFFIILDKKELDTGSCSKLDVGISYRLQVQVWKQLNKSGLPKHR